MTKSASKTKNTAATAAAETAGSPAPAQAPEATPAAEPVAPAAEPAAEPIAPVDIFANVPLITIGEANNIPDLSGIEAGPARKYAKLAEEAALRKLPVKERWKHMQHVFVPGHNKGGENGFKQGSVLGTIQQIVQAAGKAGINSYDLATALRKAQVGNKRSVYCAGGKLPVVGWAEGYIDHAVQKSIINVHATKKAPTLGVPVAPVNAEATPEQNQQAITDQSVQEAGAEVEAEQAQEAKAA